MVVVVVGVFKFVHIHCRVDFSVFPLNYFNFSVVGFVDSIGSRFQTKAQIIMYEMIPNGFSMHKIMIINDFTVAVVVVLLSFGFAIRIDQDRVWLNK